MNDFFISLDTMRHSSVPSQSTVRFISLDISSQRKPITQSYIKSFVGLIAKEGCAICPSTYKTSFESISRDSNNFIQQQLFVLDFNRGTTFDEIKLKADRYELPILRACLHKNC